jgi:hypothetical protein
MSNAGGMSTITRYTDMLAGNTTWNPWEPQGAYDALSTVTVPSGGVASITFAGIPQGYKHLQVRVMTRSTASGGEDFSSLRLNGDSGSSYYWHFLFGNGASANASNPGASSTFIYPYAIPASGFLANSFGVQVIDILDYSSTSKNTTVRTVAGYDDNSTGGRIALTSGAWFNASAVNSLTFTCGGNFAQHSQFTLYGVK